ncbi:MAG: hypothetical protein D6732_03190, partial [Methanobacteriota archaeon]
MPLGLVFIELIFGRHNGGVGQRDEMTKRGERWMSVISRLATSLGRRDDVPNQELAKELVETQARADIAELVAN